jgi:Domain of unknown function (DUF1735)
MMKANNFFIKIRTVSIAVMALCVFVFSSCLKDKAPGNENYSHSPALVGFQYTGFSSTPIVAALLPVAQDSFGVEVTLSVASVTLTSAVTFTVIPYQAGLDSFNKVVAASGSPTVYQPLDPSLYTLPNGGSVTINPGQQIITFKILFAGDKIDFTKDNALSLQISNPKGAIVASNLSNLILTIKLKSVYEGNYVNSGTITRFNGGSEGSGVRDHFAIIGTTFFSTVGVNEIDGGISIPGFSAVNFTLTVNPDFSVTIGSSISNFTAAMSNTPGKPSTYDPTTKTFDIHGAYLNSAGALREFDATLVFQP